MMRWLIHFQSFYYAVAALWALVDINSFMLVTGPKTDVWLVKTVSWLLLIIAATLQMAYYFQEINRSITFLASFSAIVLGGVDLYYWLQGTISPVYLLDALIEFLVLALWLSLEGVKYERYARIARSA